MKHASSWKTSLLLGILSWLTALTAAAQPAAQKQVQYLSGTDNTHTKTWDFYCTGGRKSGYWTTIQVPSCWEQQGFGTYNYGRDYKTYGKGFRFADEQGQYKHRFNVPAAWRGRQVFIVLEGAMTDTEVKVNDQLAGPVHQGAFYRFKYDLTEKLKYGQDNLLEITVRKMSADASVNNAERYADYWVFGGLFRPVYLEAYPQQFIPKTSINAKADGSFAVNVHVRGLRQVSEVQAELRDLAGQLVGTARATAGPADTLVTLRTQVNKPRLWTSETPTLYRATLRLAAGGQALYETSERFGFRTVEVRHGRGIFVNGVQVKMKGVNRHSWWTETGRTLNDSIHLLDVKLMKEMNMNAVRMSHYPPDARFLDMCDSLGLYVLDELTGWQQAYRTSVGKKLVKEMVEKDVNHPSILFWSNGNEGGTNKELDAEFGKYDLSNRIVIHAHHRPGNAFNGIDTNHYEDYNSTKKILADSLIYMPTEFLHAQFDGGGGSGLADFWELHWHSPRSGGGFIWAFLDEGIARTDLHGTVDVNGGQAPDGVVGPHREKEGSFYAIREIFSPIQARIAAAPPAKTKGRTASPAPLLAATPPVMMLPADFKGVIAIENRYHFTNLNQCAFRWELVRYRRPGETLNGAVRVAAGRATSPSVAPLATGQLQLALPADWRQADALRLAVYDPQHQLVYQWSWATGSPAKVLAGIVPPPSQSAPAVAATETDSTLTLQAAAITVTFSKRTGQLANLKSSGGNKLALGGGPQLASGQATFQGLSHRAEPDGEVVEARYAGDLRSVRWKMHASGWLQLDYEYVAQGDHPFAGLSFTYPESRVLGARWLGRGPYRVWKNRLRGVTTDVWENAYNNTQTGAAPWVYPEFKGYFADIHWLELNTEEGKFVVATPDAGLYARLFDFSSHPSLRPHPALPSGNLSFLDAIPPVGTKLGLNPEEENTKGLGPESELNHLSGPRHRTLYFYFGTPPLSSPPLPYAVPAPGAGF